MDVFKSRSSRFISTLPVRLYRALPAVILGTLFNVLDTVSSGILLFPTEDGAFRSLQLQALSMYITSTITSQVAVALGGSRFPGALAGMLVEILPFLQGVASNIRSVLGDDHPGLVPTVMAAYALTSFLTGAAFVILGLLKLGNFVAYFPQTVLTGAIGAIGVSLFVLGLGLPFPPSATPLSLSNVTSTLFNKSHLSLLAASFFPAFILSITLRSRYIELWTRGLVRSAYYIPLFLLLIPTVFWTAVWSLKVSQEHLIAAGWLFTVESTSSAASVASWNYWTLFNFGLVEWWSLKSAIQNIVLLVVVGVLNLPIYVPTLAFTLDVSYDMNHELLGQGVANILAGVVGTVPNILQYSYSVYFTRAKGGRFELWLVILLTAALFFISGLLLPHVPTILASALVLFLGMELFLEATWEASKTLAWMEYAVVMGTLAACTFLGFAEGFGVGIGAAMVVYLMYGVIDSPARVTWWNEWNELQQVKNQDEDRVAVPVKGRLVSPRNYTPPVITLDAPRASADVDDTDILQHINARVVVLSGYIFFASVPSIEKELLDSKIPAAFFILDLARAHRIETTAARCLPRCARELELRASRLVICGLAMGSGLHADFERAEIPLGFDLQEVEGNRNGIPAFTTREACVAWCEREHEKRAALDNKSEGLDAQTKEGTFKTFCRLFNFELPAILNASDEESVAEESDIDRFIDAGRRITVYLPGQVIRCTVVIFVVEGQINLVGAPAAPAASSALRPSVQRLLAMVPGEMLRAVRARFSVFSRALPPRSRDLKPGDAFNCRTQADVAVAKTRSVVVEVEGEPLMAWAEGKLEKMRSETL